MPRSLQPTRVALLALTLVASALTAAPAGEIALVRSPATDREHRIGSLFMNPGGPGVSGVEFARTMQEAIWRVPPTRPAA
jgi:hypothetical protein